MEYINVRKQKNKLFVLLSILSFVMLPMHQVKAMNGQNQKVTIVAKNQQVDNVFKEITKQTSLKFFYGEAVANSLPSVNLNYKDADLDVVLKDITKQTSLHFSRENNTISVTKVKESPVLQSSDKKLKISGVITDDKGETVIGATVTVKGTALGAMADADGKYILNDVPADATITVSYIGMTSKDVPVAGKSVIDVQLTSNSVQLTEVVAIGYGTVRKSDLTGALSSVSSKQFQDQKVTRIDDVLQGRSSGVQISNTVGAPGGDVRIRIRGVNSVLGDNSPLFVIDGFVGADFNSLNPNDIKSIEVLKDASSTAIYGSRGANGVVLVTTKNGMKGGKTTVTYQGSYSLATVLKKYDMLSASEFAETANQKNIAFGVSPIYTQAQIDNFKTNGGFDYQDAIFRTAQGTQHQLEISGGTDKTTFLISGNYLNQQGVVENSSFDRYTVRTNFQTQISDKLSFRFNLNGATMTGLNTQSRTGAGNPLVQALAWAPTTNPYDGKGGYLINDPISSIKSNPLALVYDSENRYERTFANILSGAKYEIIKGLSADFQVGANLSFLKRKTFAGVYVSNNAPSAGIAESKIVNIQTTTQLSYEKEFNKIHRINAVAVFETQKNSTESESANAQNLKFPNLKYDNLALSASQTANSGFSKWSLLSYLGRINYSLMDKYLFSVSVRRDGSSKFASGNKYSTFPSAALAWNAGNEDFINKLNVFDKLKARVSWGKTGSQAIEPYATLGGYDTDLYYAFNTGDRTSGIQLGNPANKYLKWETTEQKDLGIEMAFLNGRLTFDFDYYIKDTKDLLLPKSVPFYLGGGSIVSNVGKIRNKGFDMAIGATIVSTNDITWQSNFNLSKVKNRVKDLGEEQRILSSPNITGMATIPEFIYQVGQPLGSFWGLKYLGPWKASEATEAAKYGKKPGDARYEDLNGDHTISGDDYQIIGCGQPTTTLGWNNMISINNFSANIFFQGSFGAKKLNYTRAVHLRAAGDVRYATLAEIKDRYIAGVNEDAYLPAFSTSSTIEPQSTMFLDNADYVRLKNVSIAYNFNVKSVGKVKLSLNATNLLTFTKYKGLDPEASNVGGGGSDVNQSVDYGAYPNSRTYTIGVDVTF